MVICLERGADLHMAKLMPLPLTVSCFIKIQIGLPFWYQLIQVVLPVKDGGLGVRRVISLALPAFLASAASTLPLQDAILSGTTCYDNRYFQSYLITWSSRYGTVTETLPTKQPFWD